MRFLALVLCAACASAPPAQPPAARSGLAGDTRVRDLSPADRETLCTWWGQTLGGDGRMQSCTQCTGNACVDWDVTVSSLQDCTDWLATVQCDATVDNAESCALAQEPDLCAAPAACKPFDGC